MASAANLLLSVFLAIATVAQALILWRERETPLRNAIYDRKIAAAIQAADMIEEGCRLRYSPEQSGRRQPERQADWLAMMGKRRQAQLTLKTIADKELLDALNAAYDEEDKFATNLADYMKKNREMSKIWGDRLAFWDCNKIAEHFIEKVRANAGIQRLSQDIVEKLRDGNVPKPLTMEAAPSN